MRRPRTLVLAAALTTALATSTLVGLAAPGAASTPTAVRSATHTVVTATKAHKPVVRKKRPKPVVRKHKPVVRTKHKTARPTKVIMPVRQKAGLARGTATAAITYHGGKVMTGTVHLYVIWYGAWSGKPAVPLLTDLLRGFAFSPYAGTNATYTDKKKHPVSTDVQYAASTDDAYSKGTTLTDAGVRAVVVNAIHTRALPSDSNGIYLVLTSADVKETSGFGSRYCGWHSRTTFLRKPVRFVFAGDPSTQAANGCEPRVTRTPNGDRGADAMASTIVHEIDETLTDPDIDAWYDRWGSENADKCAWTYGYTYVAGNGGTANVRLGGHDFLVQQNWVARARQGCALS
jgi:hypothetical protein